MKIFVIDFSNDTSLIEICSTNDNEVQFEQKDGAKAYSKSREFMPELIVVNYSEKPSHGRITAIKINQRKMTSHIPIYFVDGNEKENEKIKSFGTIIASDELKIIMKNE